MIDDPAGLTKSELAREARRLGIPGRSRMTKAELITAISRERAAQRSGGDADELDVSPRTPPISIPGISSEDRTEARERRAILHERLRAYVDDTSHCPWRSIEGHPCGLPVVAGTERCALHGDGRIADIAFPVTGSLGFAAWPALWRHLTLATYDVDAFGLDPVVAEMAWHLLNGLYYDYFRVEVEGVEHVPSAGPAVVVANHGGALLPYDAAMLSLAVMNEAVVPRRVRVVGTEIFNMLPFVSHLYRKVGAAYAARDDAREILRRGHVLGVFPEGERGFMKPVWEAYRVGRLGRGGFVEIAQEAGAPIVPVAIVGSEEVHPAITTSKLLARLIRLVFPEQRVEEIAIALNPVPLPIRWKIRFLPPIPAAGAASGLDSLEQLERSEDVRRSIQDALDDILATRRTAF
jgi:1-acyl-sn-glycerol-3-phosphate acyltransferase